MKNKPKTPFKCYFIGICGISMSALAKLAIASGCVVYGSDLTCNHITNELTNLGATIYNYHDKSHITSDIDLVIFSGAIKEDNPERMQAKELGIRQMERSKYLAYVSSRYSQLISVAGTHGKTTTTCMIGEILISAGINPTIHLGGESALFGNIHIGCKSFFVTEACEYRNSFGYLNSDISVITNIEPDHLDYYGNFNNLKLAFSNFAHNSRKVVVWGNRVLASKLGRKCLVVGRNKRDNFFVCNVRRNGDGLYSYSIKYNNEIVANIHLSQPGVHLVKDSACAFAVAYVMGVDAHTIVQALYTYHGVKRRNELIGYNGYNIPIICDYAHHPTEIQNTIKEHLLIYKRILCVFQPHTYTRTKALMKDFIHCFEGVSKLMIYKTYEARENYIYDGDAFTLYNNVIISNKEYYDNIENLIQVVEKSKDYDLVLVLGAGDIYDHFKNKYSL